MLGRTGWMLLGLALVVAGCTGDREVEPSATTTIAPSTPLALEPAALIRPYACAFDVSRGNADDTIRLAIQVRAEEDTGLTPGMTSVGRVPDGEWEGRVFFGSNLFAFYCNDVIDGPEGVVTATWEIIDGTVEIVSLTATRSVYCRADIAASGLVARDTDGRLVDVGDLNFSSFAWGLFPGSGGGVTCRDPDEP